MWLGKSGPGKDKVMDDFEAPEFAQYRGLATAAEEWVGDVFDDVDMVRFCEALADASGIAVPGRAGLLTIAA